MKTNSLDEAFRSLNEQLMSVERTSLSLTAKFEDLSREAEGLKLGVLERALENNRVSQAKQLGFTAMRRDHGKLGIGLALAVGQSLLQGAVSKDKSVALTAGISSLNGFAEGLGDSRWAVSLDRQFIVVPRDKVFSGRVWVTWESLQAAMKELKQRAIGGEELGDLDTIIDKLKHGWSKLVYLLIPVSEETHLGRWRRVPE